MINISATYDIKQKALIHKISAFSYIFMTLS